MIFNLEATSDYFNLSNNKTRLPIINFEHCFQFLSKEDIFQDIYCEKCKNTYISKYKENIYSMPNYLIIILNRGKGNIFNCQVQIPEKFNSLKYIEKKDNNTMYELIGIVSHFGESGMGGHFIAFCKHNIDKKWRCYNDSIVTECKNDYLNKGIPYILFYKKENILINNTNINNNNSPKTINNNINNCFQNNNVNNISLQQNMNINNNNPLQNMNMINQFQNNNMMNNIPQNMNNYMNNNLIMNYNNINNNLVLNNLNNINTNLNNINTNYNNIYIGNNNMSGINYNFNMNNNKFK